MSSVAKTEQSENASEETTPIAYPCSSSTLEIHYLPLLAAATACAALRCRNGLVWQLRLETMIILWPAFPFGQLLQQAATRAAASRKRLTSSGSGGGGDDNNEKARRRLDQSDNVGWPSSLIEENLLSLY